jgi:hypothetical protein
MSLFTNNKNGISLIRHVVALRGVYLSTYTVNSVIIAIGGSHLYK